MTISTNGRRFARSTSITGRHGRRPWQTIVFSSSKLVALYHAAISASICGLFAQSFPRPLRSARTKGPLGSTQSTPSMALTCICRQPGRAAIFAPTVRKGCSRLRRRSRLHVQPLQKVYGDVAPRLERRHFPRRHQGNGFACITAVRAQSFGGIHFGNTFGWRAQLDGYMMDLSNKSPFGLFLPV
jgi:hypothetical protein